MRAFWLKQLHSWHWISAALSLAGMLLFSVTGLTLNHASLFSARGSSESKTLAVPPPLRADLQALPEDGDQPLPPSLSIWIKRSFDADMQGLSTESDADAVYVSQSLPGAEATLEIDRNAATATFTVNRRGWVAYFNDLHKGRHTGPVWSAFIDLLAISCIVFTLTGLALLWMHGRTRTMTWPLTGLSLLAPLLIALLFIHG